MFTTECDNLQHPPIGAESYQILSIYDSFSSQTWAILYLTETLILSQSRAKQSHPPVICQNQEDFKTYMIFHNTILKIQIKWVPDVIKTTSRTFLKTSEPEETIQHNIFSKKLDFIQVLWRNDICFLEFWPNIADIHNLDIWLVGDFIGFCFNFWSKFLLGTKSPMSGKRMSHRLSVFDKIQSI